MFTYLFRIGIALSVLLNVLLGGQSNQTFSARNYGWKRAGKLNIVWLIDGLFNGIACITSKLLTFAYKRSIVISLENHCMECWVYWRSRKDVVHELDPKSDKEL